MIDIKAVNYQDSEQAQQLVYLLNQYALDPMGGGDALAEQVQLELAVKLADRSDTFSFIAYDDDQPVGLVNCVEGFSTFAAKPVMNIHDVVVLPTHRGKGISTLLLNEVEQLARQRDCCKLTLEVLQGNKVAKASYLKFGFAGYELDPEMGQAMFWQKKL
ncbi:GNAT family N-acetyltransferase [Alkalimonas collagenimarina]|uniref:GNAT family N-acetyltransferase n=1 Tax=Alkalimonas collagenimarina TaxID=400390 RepID=A0ABT9GXG3_9GAMM|nr:GNAT family N-acetyltransferase [Alkalimonas collagenimarina]MDP4535743.1 GNAT family N-acetyltransferase [Alkalimonas collagenimarina]